MKRALEGIRVVDVSQGIAGPHAGMLLAQHGADVIKVEPPEGDWGRTLGKHYGEYCAQAITFNRGKRSIVLDLKSESGKEALRRICEGADIFIESFRPGVIERLGFGYPTLSAGNEKLIYLSVSGFGQKGPYRDLRVTDSVIQAFSGWMTLHRDSDGTPLRSGITAIDVLTGLYGYQAITTALIARLRGAPGRHIDLSMMHAAAAFQAGKLLEHHLQNGQPEVSYVPVGVMPTRDGYIVISAMRDSHFQAMCEVLGRPGLAEDPAFAKQRDRRINKDRLMPILYEAFRTRPTSYWQEHLTVAGVMNARVNTFLDFLADEHVRQSGITIPVDHPEVGLSPAISVPGMEPPAPEDPRLTCPAIGEHTHEILREYGLSLPAAGNEIHNNAS